MEFFETVKTRKSTREFTGAQISEADLNEILLAGNAAPIGMRKFESIHLTVVQNKELLDDMQTAAATAFGDASRKPIYDAPTLIIVSSQELGNSIEYANVGCVMENMALAATALGLGNIYLWGITAFLSSQPDFLQKLQIPDGFKPISALAVGYAVEELKPEKPWKHIFTMNRV